MMKLSMLSLVSVVVADRTKCENPDPDFGQAQCLTTLILLKFTDSTDPPENSYTPDELAALQECADDLFCEPQCTCFVDGGEDGQIWLYTPEEKCEGCLQCLTDISTDASAVYYVDLDLDGALKSHRHHGNHECTEVEEAEGDKVNEFIDFVDGGLISGRVGINNSDTTSNLEGATDDVCSAAQATCWYGSNVLPVCAKYNAYLESEKEKGLAECYAPADYNVALADGDDGVTVDLDDKPVVISKLPAPISQ